MIPRRVELEPSPGHRLVADHLLGAPPAFVYMHGLTSVRAGEKSDALLAHARQRDRGFLRFDFRGHGESSGQIGAITVSELIEDGVTVLHHQGRAILVGSSMGGLVAAWIGALHQDLVAGLVLLSPALGFLGRMASRAEGATTLRPNENQEVQLAPRVLDDAARYDETLLPKQLAMPVLIVHGTEDDVVPFELSERLYAGIPHPHKRLWVVQGGDHRLNEPIHRVYAMMDELMGEAR